MDSSRIYPNITIARIENPNRLWAIPLFGGLAKFIILIPVYLVIVFYALVAGSLVFINSFVVLFTGKYSIDAYNWDLKLMRILCKTSFFFMGLTDKYPGFRPEIQDFTFDIAYPENPNKLYAVPIIGILIRFVLMIPYLIFISVLQWANNLGVFVVSSFSVLFTGRYPESIYELARDFQRVSFASQIYFAGISDRYPSFWISMNHKGIKIILLVLGTLLAILNLLGRGSS